MRFLLSVLFVCGLCVSVWADTTVSRFVFFEKTQYPLEVYVLEGKEAGPTILVQGGIQGDELSGFMTAELLASAQVKKGRIILVPRANVPSIHLRRRQVNVDMNRRFDRRYGQFYEDIVALAVRRLLQKCNGFIHLHEGSGFYSPVYVNQSKNPKRYGQSVIIDAEKYQNLQLGEMCRRVLKRFNPSVQPQAYAFSLFNTRTIENNSQYLEQRKSLSYYALTQLKIPAVAIEVSKAIGDLNWKVRQQLGLTLAFLQEMGVEAQCEIGDKLQKWSLVPDLQVNGKKVKESCSLQLGTELIVELGEKRGGACYAVFASDRPGYDLLKDSRYLLQPFRSLDIYADGKKIHSCSVSWQKAKTENGKKGDIAYKLNGKTLFAAPGKVVKVQSGDRLVLEGVVGGKKNEVLNVKGYVANPPGVYNGGQDMGVEIVLSRDMFLPRYVKKNGDNWAFGVERETSGIQVRPVTFEVQELHSPVFVLSGEQERILLYTPRQGEIEIPVGEYRFGGGWAGKAGEVHCFFNGRLLKKDEKISFSENKKNVLQLVDKNTFFVFSDIVFIPIGLFL